MTRSSPTRLKDFNYLSHIHLDFPKSDEEVSQDSSNNSGRSHDTENQKTSNDSINKSARRRSRPDVPQQDDHDVHLTIEAYNTTITMALQRNTKLTAPGAMIQVFDETGSKTTRSELIRHQGFIGHVTSVIPQVGSDAQDQHYVYEEGMPKRDVRLYMHSET